MADPQEAEALQAPARPDTESPFPQADAGTTALAGAGVVQAAKDSPVRNVDQLMRIPVSVTVILAKKQMLLDDILHLSTGSVVEFDKSHKDVIELVVGGKAIATGEAITIRDKFGMMITRIGSVQETLNKLREELETS